jgi:hypothetical protein
MTDNNKTKKEDMELIAGILPYTSHENIPVSFICGGKKIKGIPADFNPKISRRLLDCNILQVLAEGEKNGLVLRAEYLEYRDFPVTEWVFYIENRGTQNTPIISELKLDSRLCGENPVLIHGNGDSWFP